MGSLTLRVGIFVPFFGGDGSVSFPSLLTFRNTLCTLKDTDPFRACLLRIRLKTPKVINYWKPNIHLGFQLS